MRLLLRKVLEDKGRLELVASVKAKHARPLRVRKDEMVILDVEMPGMTASGGRGGGGVPAPFRTRTPGRWIIL
jgi:DNA-binding NarL/FixJ family response regulator